MAIPKKSLRLVIFSNKALIGNPHFCWFGLLFDDRKHNYYFGYMLYPKSMVSMHGLLSEDNSTKLKKNLGRYMTIQCIPDVDTSDGEYFKKRFFGIESDYMHIMDDDDEYPGLSEESIFYLGMLSLGEHFDNITL